MSTHDSAEGADNLAKPARSLPTLESHRALERAATGRAFAAFYREAIKPLIAYLIVSGAPAAIAAEIAQDCMIELLRRWDSVKHPRAYVYKAAGRMWTRRRGVMVKTCGWVDSDALACCCSAGTTRESVASEPSARLLPRVWLAGGRALADA